MQDIIIEGTNQSSKAVVHLKESRGIFGYLFDWGVNGVLVALLLGIDFLLFAGAGNQRIFSNGFSIQPEIFTGLTVILAFSFVVMFLVSFSSLLQKIVMAIIGSGVVWALLSQFAVYDKTSILGPMLFPYIGGVGNFIFNGVSHWILAGGAGILLFVVLMMSSRVGRAYFTGCFLVIFLGVLVDNYLIPNKTDNFVVRYENRVDDVQDNPRKYVYLFLPNAASYITLGEMKDPLGNVAAADELKGKLVAFLAKNGFWVYPNAYVNSTDALNNAVEFVNNLDEKKADEHILKNVEIDSLWNFSDVKDEYVFMKNTKLIDVYKNSNYRVTAIQSRGLDLCHKNNVKNVDKCIDKINMPVAVDNLKASSWEKSKFLLIQWLNSWHLVSDWSIFYNTIDGFVNAGDLPIVGKSYDSLYVVNSFEALDKLVNDISKDKENRAYFVFLDLPSDMFVYNEFCQLKPRSQWQTLANYKWVGNKNLFAKRKAYQEQYACLIGKLQQFLEKLKKQNLDKNTIIFLQGLNGINELGGSKTEDYIENFKWQNLVLLAVKNPMKNSFSINNQICESRELLKNYLYLKGECSELKGMGLYSTSLKALQDNLLTNVLSQETINGYIDKYDEWYKKWENINSQKSPKNILENKLLKVKNEDDKQKIDKEIMPSDGVQTNAPQRNMENEKSEMKAEASVELPPERKVEQAKLMEEPINEGKEQEVESIKNKIQEDSGETLDSNLKKDDSSLKNIKKSDSGSADRQSPEQNNTKNQLSDEKVGVENKIPSQEILK